MSEALAETLLKRKALTAEQLRAAQAAQQVGDVRRGVNPGDPLGQICILLGFAQPVPVALALCETYNLVNYLLIDNFPVDPLVAARVDIAQARAYQALPLLRLERGRYWPVALESAPWPLHRPERGRYLFAAAVFLTDDARRYFRSVLDDFRVVEYLPMPGVNAASLLDNVASMLASRGALGVRLGEILLRDGHIAAQALEQALHSSQQSNMPLGRYLARTGLVEDGVIAHILAGMAQIPYLPTEDVIKYAVGNTLKDKIKKDYVRHNGIAPLQIRGRTLLTATSNPFANIGELAGIFECDRVERVAVTESGFAQLFQQLYGEALDPSAKVSTTDMSQVMSASDLGPEDDNDVNSVRRRFEKMLNAILMRAIDMRSSDIHIETFEKHVQIRLRVDGILHVMPEHGVTRENLRGFMNIIKIESDLNIAETRQCQGGSFRKITPDGRPYDFRVQIMPSVHGECGVLRLLPGRKKIPTLAQIGFPERILQGMERAVANPSGLILVTGPTGSGKTTTLCSCLAHVAQDPANKVLTVEDPVEYALPNVTQIETIAAKGVDFMAACRGFMRMDPDVILIGEIRDHETANEALKLAYSGHQTFSTLHTSNAVATVERMYGFGLDRTLLIEQMLAVNSQRLMRRLCPHCRVPYQPTDEDLAVNLPTGVPKGMKFYTSAGCSKCMGMGHGGRCMLAEFLNFTGNSRAIFRKENEQNRIYVHLMGQGLECMIDDALLKVHHGIIDLRWLPEVIPQDYLEMGPSSVLEKELDPDFVPPVPEE